MYKFVSIVLLVTVHHVQSVSYYICVVNLQCKKYFLELLQAGVNPKPIVI